MGCIRRLVAMIPGGMDKCTHLPVAERYNRSPRVSSAEYSSAYPCHPIPDVPSGHSGLSLVLPNDAVRFPFFRCQRSSGSGARRAFCPHGPRGRPDDRGRHGFVSRFLFFDSAKAVLSSGTAKRGRGGRNLWENTTTVPVAPREGYKGGLVSDSVPVLF